jgi:thiosulfate/3-mercaptopyruvate sulfurtransferase
MLRAFGHTKSSVLDGGLPRWIAEGKPVDSNNSPLQETSYAEPKYNEDVIRSEFIALLLQFDHLTSFAPRL